MDTINVEILPDGTIKVETGVVSQANHLNGESFLREMAKLTGGEVTVRHKHGAHSHAHTHSHGNEAHQH